VPKARPVLVERFARGADHRLLVVGDRMIAAARRDPPQVLGDGKSTVAELVAAVNSDPLRGEDHSTSLSKMRLDAIGLAVLAGQGYTPDSIPAAGTQVLLRQNGNLSTGGSATDVTTVCTRKTPHVRWTRLAWSGWTSPAWT